MTNDYNKDLREELAAVAHDAWSGWINYMFSKCAQGDDGTLVIPAWAVERWQRQASAPYAKLPENEKVSDRIEADRYLAVLGAPWRRCPRCMEMQQAAVCIRCGEYTEAIAGERLGPHGVIGG